MRLEGIIRSISVKQSKDGPIVVTTIETDKRQTPLDELGTNMGIYVDITIEKPQLSFLGGNVDRDTGEIRG